MNFVYFSQADPQWKDMVYGDCEPPTTLEVSGCGPVAMAMIISSLTNADVEPPEIANLAVQNEFRKCGVGTLHSFGPFVAKKYSLEFTELGQDLKKATDLLKNGGLIWASFGPGLFTDEGHLMVIKGVDENGFRLADPNSENGKTKGESNNKTYTASELLGEGGLRAMYGFSKP
jgi:Peptidase_C39 like family